MQSSRQDPLLPLSVSPDGRLKDEDKGQLKGRRMLNPRPFVHSTECENGPPSGMEDARFDMDFRDQADQKTSLEMPQPMNVPQVTKTRPGRR